MVYNVIVLLRAIYIFKIIAQEIHRKNLIKNGSQ